MTMVTLQQRRLAGPAYIGAFGLVVFPIFDQLMQLVSTAKLHDARWRFGAAGLVSNLMVLPVLGLVIMFVVACVFEHRIFQRIMSVLCLLGAFGLVAATGVFALDAIQVRALMPPQAMSSWAVATATAIVKLGTAMLAIAWLGVAGVRNSSVNRAQRQAPRIAGSDLVLGGSRQSHFERTP